ncbi:hypothetical protein B7463_g810, partial [Scytalidium lignicola]
MVRAHPTPAILGGFSLIIYFNETDDFPVNEFVIESFEHKYDRGWNALYRQGAAVENVKLKNDSTARNLTGLAMYCNPSDDKGLVMGASIRTARQDIFFGSFRSSMRAPRKWFKGSALSMVLEYNKTEHWDIDTINTDNSTEAWVSMLTAGEFSNTWLGTNFTNLTAAGLDPWYYLEYRVDWTRDRIDYYVGNILWKTYTAKENKTLPSTPAPLRWQHWSLGNKYHTQGPPGVQSEANIGWTRVFFNSSQTTSEEQQAFDSRCTPSDACLMNNNQLRGSTPHSQEALQPWKQSHPKWKVPWIPLTVVVVFSFIFAFVTIKTLICRFSRDAWYEFLGVKKKTSSSPTVSALRTGSGVPTTTTETSSRRSSETGASSQGSSDDFIRGSFRRDALFSTITLPTYSNIHSPAPQYQSPIASTTALRANSLDRMTIKSLSHPEPMGSLQHMAGQASKTSRVAGLQSGHREEHTAQTLEPTPATPIASNFANGDGEKSAEKVEVTVETKDAKLVAAADTVDKAAPLPR